MTPDKLVEAVAKEIAVHAGARAWNMTIEQVRQAFNNGEVGWKLYIPDAKAAILITLEEAAKVADDFNHCSYPRLAAAIRNMKDQPR